MVEVDGEGEKRDERFRILGKQAVARSCRKRIRQSRLFGKNCQDTIKSGHWKPADNMTNNVGKDGTLFGGFTAVSL